MYGEKYPTRVGIEVEHVSDGAYVWVDADEYGLGHERYGECPPAVSRREQVDQAEVAEEVQ